MKLPSYLSFPLCHVVDPRTLKHQQQMLADIQSEFQKECDECHELIKRAKSLLHGARLMHAARLIKRAIDAIRYSPDKEKTTSAAKAACSYFKTLQDFEQALIRSKMHWDVGRDVATQAGEDPHYFYP